MTNQPAYLAILASGGGSNAAQICEYFSDHSHIRVKLIITNRKNAGVIDVAQKHDVDCVYISKNALHSQEKTLPILQEHGITHLVLAGFLLLLPPWLIDAFPKRIINIHPSLLPKYGGQGMFGIHVHTEVKKAGDLVSGITIHEVDEHYDEGDIIFQESIDLDPDDNASDIAIKVLRLEHYHYPRVIEKWVDGYAPQVKGSR